MKKTDLSERSVNELFSFLNIIRISLDEKAFREWLQNYHKIGNDEKYLAGYGFFLETCMRCLTNAIEVDSAIGLAEDDVFGRTRFVELRLSDIPNTCEKTIFIKNLWEYMKPIKDLRKWDEIDRLADSMIPLFQIFDKIYKDYVISTRKDLEKDEMLKISTMANTFRLLNDTERGFPLGYILVVAMEHRGPVWPPMDMTKDKRYFASVFGGYVYALEYLWFKLLGEERFQGSCTSSLHKTDRDRARSKSGNEKRTFGQRGTKKWWKLDRYFDRIEKEIIEPLEKKKQMDTTEPLLILSKNFRKQAIQQLLDPRGLKDPPYLSGQDKESIKKRLAYNLLWYPVSVLDATGIFNGVPALVRVIAGEAERRRLLKHREEMKVRVFKHPTEETNHNYYSYAVLLPASGSVITDYSGWLVFFDCATDFSGFGASLYRMANEYIERYRSKHILQVEESTVDKEIFKEFISERNVSSAFGAGIYRVLGGTFERLTTSQLVTKIREWAYLQKGKFLEYLFYTWLAEGHEGPYSNIKCDITEDGEQIDDLAEDDSGSISLFECKIAVHTDEVKHVIDQITRKKALLESRNPGRGVTTSLVVYAQVREDHIKRFANKGIRVRAQFGDKIEKWEKLSSQQRRQIREILEFDL